jgi:hypothetical protein
LTAAPLGQKTPRFRFSDFRDSPRNEAKSNLISKDVEAQRGKLILGLRPSWARIPCSNLTGERFDTAKLFRLRFHLIVISQVVGP